MTDAIEKSIISVAYTYGAITDLPIYSGYILGAIQQNLGVETVDDVTLNMAVNVAKTARTARFDSVITFDKLRPIRIFDKEYSHTEVRITGSEWYGHTSLYRTR